jgi:thymidine phosphorylase
VLSSGRALTKFYAICEAQGGFTEPGVARYRADVAAPRSGRIQAIDNRRLAKVAKLAGAPISAMAGLAIGVRIDDPIAAGAPLFQVHAQTNGELRYALEYVAAHPDIVAIAET